MLKVLSILIYTTVLISGRIAAICAEHNQIVAVVNDFPILKADLKARVDMAILSSSMPNDSRSREYLMPQILKLMIDEQLQICCCEKYKITLTPAEIDQAVDMIEYRNGMKKGQLKSMLKESNIPFEIMHKHLTASLAWRDYTKERYENLVQITDEEIHHCLDVLEISKKDEQVMLAEIFLSSGDSAQESLRNAQKMAENLRQGAHFSALAQEFSNAPSAIKGGDIGWIAISRLDPKLQAVVRQTKVGQITEPIQTQNGYYILFVRDQRAPGESPDKDTLLTFNQLMLPASIHASQDELQDTFMQAQRLGKAAKNCDMLKTLSQGIKGSALQSVKRTSVRDLPPELKDLLLKLDIYQASRPVLSDSGMLMFMMCEKEEFNPQTPHPDEVRALLTDQKLGLLAQQELRSIRRKASIVIH